MARAFSGTAQYLQTDTAVVTSLPLTMACWFNTSVDTVRDTLMWIGDKDVTDQWWSLEIDGGAVGNPVVASSRASSTVNAYTSTGFTANTWHHAAAVHTSTTSRTAYIDGGSAGSNTTSNVPTGHDRTSIAQAGDSTPSTLLTGNIAEAAVWNIALDAADIASLAKGYSPLLVRPESLVAYWPLIGNFSPEINVVGGVNLTVTDATKFPHPRIIYPSASQIRGFGSVAPATSVKDLIGSGFIPFAR